MSNTKKIIIISEAFLITSGIESLALEINGLLVHQIYTGKEKRLFEKIISKKAEFVIIDPDAAGDNLLPLLRLLNNEPDIKTIGLISNKTESNIVSKFSNTLDITETKYQLINSLQKIVGISENDVTDNDQILSKRENEILRQLTLGLTNQEVADKLFISIHTVMTHRKKITRKLGIKTISGLTVYALMNNLVDIREVERGV